MSIPLDRLYHYIESVAKDVYGDTIIYRFWPHGSKNIEDLEQLRPNDETMTPLTPVLICNDQESLDYENYQSITLDQIFSQERIVLSNKEQFVKLLHKIEFNSGMLNLFAGTVDRPFSNLYDQCLLLHSEKRSYNVDLYQNSGFIPVYYWSHAVIALDWFRYAEHQHQSKSTVTKPFLIYNRAWSGTREYRLKFADLLIEHNLVGQCQTSLGFTDSNIHYQNHIFKNQQWKPKNQLEDFFVENLTTSCYSADFNLSDYNNTDVEVVLETLFDDSRLHLTEKILRPIACGQPFILAATQGSLSYLRDYGFKTFEGIIDETYDTINDPVQRLQAVVDTMKSISKWSKTQRQEKLAQLQHIANYNQQYFFSCEFFKIISNELQQNLLNALSTLQNTNTCQRWFDLRKTLAKDPEMRQYLTTSNPHRLRQDIAKIVSIANQYKNKSNKY